MGIEKQSVDYTFAADLPLPAAREITRLIGEGAELFEDEHRCTDCVVKQLTRALDRGVPLYIADGFLQLLETVTLARCHSKRR
ncbi:hypothetical protein AB0P40_43995, partial [Streptomyces sp. NPDC079189]|uniref:hypothetical protein n=1 Tax=Streptomyces sp. NPDC079189 TaxID=3154514 RepID=UPI00343A3DBD